MILNPGDGAVPLLLLVCLSVTIFAAGARLDHRAERRRQLAPDADDRAER